MGGVLYAEHKHLLEIFKEYRLKLGQNFESTRASIEKFLSFIGDKPMESVDIDDYKNYFYYLHNTKALKYKTYSAYHGNLTSFFECLKENGVSINFLDDRQKVFNEFIATLESKDVRKTKPLSLNEWLSLKQTLEVVEEYELLYFIEIIYQYQLKNTTQMKEFHRGNYYTDYFEVTFKGKKNKYPVSKYLQYLIKKGGMPEYLTEHYINYHFRRIWDYSKEKILIGDICMTSVQNFFVCPNCRNSFENIPENWAVFDYGTPYSQLILCRRHCYEEALNG